MSTISQWVSSVGSQYGIDTSDAVAIFEEQAITLNMIPQLTNTEWKELFPKVGLRTALRKAAVDMADDIVPPDDALRAAVESAREEKESLESQEQQQKEMNDRYRSQIEMTESNLAARMSALLAESSKRDTLMTESMAASLEKSQLSSECAALKAEKAALESEKVSAIAERDAAIVQANALSSYASAVPGV